MPMTIQMKHHGLNTNFAAFYISVHYYSQLNQSLNKILQTNLIIQFMRITHILLKLFLQQLINISTYVGPNGCQNSKNFALKFKQ